MVTGGAGGVTGGAGGVAGGAGGAAGGAGGAAGAVVAGCVVAAGCEGAHAGSVNANTRTIITVNNIALLFITVSLLPIFK